MRNSKHFLPWPYKSSSDASRSPMRPTPRRRASRAYDAKLRPDFAKRFPSSLLGLLETDADRHQLCRPYSSIAANASAPSTALHPQHKPDIGYHQTSTNGACPTTGESPVIRPSRSGHLGQQHIGTATWAHATELLVIYIKRMGSRAGATAVETQPQRVHLCHSQLPSQACRSLRRRAELRRCHP